MASFKGKAAKDMYKGSPKIGKGKDGKAAVEKGPTEAEQAAIRDNGQEGGQPVTEEAMPAPVRHTKERHDLHSRHEHEHSAHDHGKKGDKKAMHERHILEMKAMHKLHEKQMMSGEADAGAEQPAAKE